MPVHRVRPDRHRDRGRVRLGRWAAGGLAVVTVAAVGLLVQGSRPSAAASNTQAVVSGAVAYAHGRGERAAVATYDRSTNKVVYAGDAGSYYASASLVKVFIAARLLETGQMTGSVAQVAYKMITQSDDASANALYGRVGGDSLYQWASARFRIPVAPPTEAGYWGLTRITALGMVSFYRQVLATPRLAAWLPNAMAHYTCPASDGWPQCMGIPSVTRAVAVKQGWMCCLDNRSRMHTTGYLDGNRVIAVMLTDGSTGTYGPYGQATLTGMAQRVLPGGHLPAPTDVFLPGPEKTDPMSPGDPIEPTPPAPANRKANPPATSPTASVPSSSRTTGSVPTGSVPRTAPPGTARRIGTPSTNGAPPTSPTSPTMSSPSQVDSSTSG